MYTYVILVRIFTSSHTISNHKSSRYLTLAQLTDVHPDGKSMLIQDGLVRLSWYADPKKLTAIQPNAIHQIKVHNNSILIQDVSPQPAQIDLASTSYIFPAGHRIRAAVSSSNYPRYSINKNTGEGVEGKGRAVVAENSIWTGPDYPSRIELPVVLLSDMPPKKLPNIAQWSEIMHIYL